MANRPSTTQVSALSQYSSTVLNNNFDTLETAVEGCLGLGGTSESNNSMSGNLDMDTHRIVNVGSPSNALDAANKQYVEQVVAGAALNTSYQKPSIYTLSDYGTDLAALTTALIAAAGSKLVINSLVNITQDYTLPSNVQIEVGLGGGFDVDNTFTLTIESPFSAGLYTIFAGTGSVEFSSGNVTEVYPEWWGTDTAAIQSALNCFVVSDVNLTFTPKEYTITSPLLVTFVANSVKTKKISGFGATLIDGLASDGTLLKIQADAPSTNAVVRNLLIEGLMFRGEDHAVNLLVLDGNSGANQEYLYGMQLNHVKFEGGTTWGATGTTGNYNALLVTDNTFELTLLECNARAQNNTVGYGFYFLTGSPSNLSSITLLDCMTDGFRTGVYAPSPTTDTRMYGGTFIRAQRFGIELANFTGCLSNCHVENNWESAADLANGNAGIKVSGQGAVIGCFGINSSKQKYVVSAYVPASANIQLIGNYGNGTTKTLLLQAADNTGSFTLLGNQTYDSTGTPRLNIIDATRIQFYMTAGKVQTSTITAGSATLTPNPLLGNVYRVVLENNATIAAVTGLTPASGDELEFVFYQGGSGSYTLTWDSSYKVGTWVPSGTVGKYNTIRFRYVDTAWVMISSAVAA